LGVKKVRADLIFGFLLFVSVGQWIKIIDWISARGRCGETK